MEQKKRLSVVIPSYNEVSLVPTLESLKRSCSDHFPIDVFLVFNASKKDSEEIKDVNRRAFQELEHYRSVNNTPYFNLIPMLEEDLDPKKAGVGLARKIGMDQSAHQFQEADIDGVIACLDADCTVSENYIEALHSYFDENPKVRACSIYFEHVFDSENLGLKEGIVQYELHLRYYKQALEYCGFPWSYHTVGSSMAVRSSTYLKSGGMNTRQAGEDFYFLQKLFSQYPFGELNEATVYPLGRLSSRVPFGTGAAMNKWDDAGRLDMVTYNLKSFRAMKEFLQAIQSMKEGAEVSDFMAKTEEHTQVIDFLKAEGFDSLLNSDQFKKAKQSQMKAMLYRWFNNFRILKCLNYLRDSGFSSGRVSENASDLLKLIGYEAPTTSEELLHLYRKLDKLAIQRKVESN